MPIQLPARVSNNVAKFGQKLMRKSVLSVLMLQALLVTSVGAAGTVEAPSPVAIKTAKYALAKYRNDIVNNLEKMVSFNTVANPTVSFEKNPEQLGFKNYLKEHAAQLGFDFTDYGYVMVIGFGSGKERVGIITHGDIQPVDPAKWAKSPFVLDKTSEPGRLLGRGTEDDKGQIASALYAMKAIKDQKLELKKRIELYVYMGEESDWGPLVEFLKTHTPPETNITLDAEYPVVIAEKGFGTLAVTVPLQTVAPEIDVPYVNAFGGGFFGSQIPEDASATIMNATPALEQAIRQRAAGQSNMRYQYEWQDRSLKITARGVSAHSSKPEDGVNAISMLADALNVRPWPNTTAGGLVNFLNDLLGTKLYGEKFGAVAYSDSFMGPMSFVPTVIKQKPDGIQLHINIRRPQGKTKAQLVEEIQATLSDWQAKRLLLKDVEVEIGEPWIQKDAPQIKTLLSVFSHFTGIKNAQPISIGGGTNSRLFPSAVSFGPTMPGWVYSGHSEHEFITLKQLLLNLEMYTAVLVELAK